MSPFSTTDSLATESVSESAVLRRATSSSMSTVPLAQAVQLVSKQIPEFGGMEEEDVELWTQKIERVSYIHGVSDEIIFLAASGRLTKMARR